MVNISIQKLLSKMEEEIQQAQKAQTDEGLRERIYSIKILCELLLDDQPVSREKLFKPIVQQPVYQQPGVAQPAFQKPTTMQQGKKLELEDGANGDSLFDF
ncbi:YwdI family protein [Neobacillus sp. LXY-1]|uniref:YwdI family protein n=1 Tax=Neobacillus sp. LXY-1 TaxID=3379133 RepID=UPI003EDF3F16